MKIIIYFFFNFKTMNIEKVLYKRLFGVVPKLNGNIYKGSKRLNKRLKFIQKEVYDKNLKV